jgi:hypothetical protein
VCAQAWARALHKHCKSCICPTLGSFKRTPLIERRALLDLGTTDSCPIVTAADSTVREALHLDSGPGALRTPPGRQSIGWLLVERSPGCSAFLSSYRHYCEIVKTVKHDAGVVRKYVFWMGRNLSMLFVVTTVIKEGTYEHVCDPRRR